MNDNHIKTLAQVRAFLEGTQAVEFSLQTKSERYDFIRRTLIRFAYHAYQSAIKGLLLSFMAHVSGYSRVQVKAISQNLAQTGAATTSLQRRQWLCPQVHRSPIDGSWPSWMNCMAHSPGPPPKSSASAPGGYLGCPTISDWQVSQCHICTI